MNLYIRKRCPHKDCTQYDGRPYQEATMYLDPSYIENSIREWIESPYMQYYHLTLDELKNVVYKARKEFERKHCEQDIYPSKVYLHEFHKYYERLKTILMDKSQIESVDFNGVKGFRIFCYSSIDSFNEILAMETKRIEDEFIEKSKPFRRKDLRTEMANVIAPIIKEKGFSYKKILFTFLEDLSKAETYISKTTISCQHLEYDDVSVIYEHPSTPFVIVYVKTYSRKEPIELLPIHIVCTQNREVISIEKDLIYNVYDKKIYSTNAHID